MEHTKNYTLTVREVLESLRTLGGSFETVSRSGSPTGSYLFPVNVAYTVASLRAAQVLISQLPCWIPVSDRLPKDMEEVLGWQTSNVGDHWWPGVFVCHRWDRDTQHTKAGEWYSEEGRLWNITHWMPLPKPPEVTKCHQPAPATDSLSQGL